MQSLILRNVTVEMVYANGKSTQGQSEKSKMTLFVGFKMRNPFLLHGKVKIKVKENQLKKKIFHLLLAALARK